MNKLVIQAIVNIVAIIGALIALINQDFWLIGNLLISLSLFMNSYNYYKLNKKDKFYIYLAAGFIFIISAMVM